MRGRVNKKENGVGVETDKQRGGGDGVGRFKGKSGGGGRGMDEIREGSRYEVESGNDKATDIIQLIFYSKITEGK